MIRRFGLGLGLVALAGFVLRVAYTLVAIGRAEPLGDDLFYYWQGQLFADGKWFVDPVAFNLIDGEIRPSAAHPPLYSMYLGLASWLGLDTPLGNRLASCALGAAMIVVVGLVARRLAGDRAGLIAAALAAAYPNLWISDAKLMAESLYALTIAGVLWAAYRFWRAPAIANAVVLGALVGIAALARSEGVLLFVLLVVPLVIVLKGVDRASKVRLGAVALLAGGVLVGPWTLANLYRFEEPVLVGTGFGQVTALAHCDRTFSGEYLGYWHWDCQLPELPPGCSQDDGLARRAGDITIPECDESVLNRAWSDHGVDYLEDHLGRLPVVAVARVGRAWDVFRPFQGVRLNEYFETRGYWPPRFGLAMYAALLPLGAIGGWRLWQRRITIVPFVALAVMVSVTAAASFGITRYRVPVDVALPILAGIALSAWWPSRLAAPSVASPVPDATVAP